VVVQNRAPGVRIRNRQIGLDSDVKADEGPHLREDVLTGTSCKATTIAHEGRVDKIQHRQQPSRSRMTRVSVFPLRPAAAPSAQIQCFERNIRATTENEEEAAGDQRMLKRLGWRPGAKRRSLGGQSS
jgi:hypothetical protein